jgi:hypothetical protein
MATARQKTHRTSGVHIARMDQLPWTATGQPGICQQEIRCDRETGRYFGAARFDPMSRSGMHRHLGPVGSYFLAGSVVDHHSEVVGGQALINLTGAVHDVISYPGALTVARVDGPILYPNDVGLYAELGAKARAAGANLDDSLGVTPNITVTLNALKPMPTGITGLSRRVIFDYAGEGCRRRYVELLFTPGTKVPQHRLLDMIDWFVLAGRVEIGGKEAEAGSFVSLDGGTKVEIVSRYGARVIAWADAPVTWLSGDTDLADLYGF